MSARLRATTTEREQHDHIHVAPSRGALLCCRSSARPSPPAAPTAPRGSDSQTITFAYQIANPDAKSVFATLAEEYEKTHKGVTIKTNPIALNTYGSTDHHPAAGWQRPRRVLHQRRRRSGRLRRDPRRGGQALDLTGKVADGSVPDNASVSMSYDGKLVAVPVYLAPAGIIFSPMAAEKSGFTIDSSSTMDDVIAQCKTVAEGGQAVFGLAGSMAPEHRDLHDRVRGLLGLRPRAGLEREEGLGRDLVRGRATAGGPPSRR